MPTFTTADYAKTYITKYGLHVVPLPPRSKVPVTKDWGQAAFSDPAAAIEHYNAHPLDNLGIALAPSRICSLDIDDAEAFGIILGELGRDVTELSDIPKIQGQPPKYRFIFRVPDGAPLDYHSLTWPKRDGTGNFTVFELRACGPNDTQRQDVFPPSIHPTTLQPYVWLTKPNGHFPEPPAWILTIWREWQKFKPQFKSMCPWAPTEDPPARISTPRTSGGPSVIDAYNAATSIESALTAYGYTQVGHRWLSPHSTTGLPGVHVFKDGRAWIHHASDPLCSDESGQPVGAFDLFCHYEHGGDVSKAVKGAVAAGRAIASATAPASGEHQPKEESPAAGDFDAWPEAHPLSVKVEPEPYPLDALPVTIRAAVEEVVAFVKAPVPMVVSSALAALSLAAQAHMDVARDAILNGPTGLFILSIADSGERKSQADKMFTAPIFDYQDAQAEIAKPVIKDYQAALSAWEAEREGILSSVRTAAKGGKPVDKLRADLIELERDKPEPPRVPKLIREDATPEGLAKKLQKEWPSAGVISNEAGIVFGAHGMNRDSVMRNLALLNKLWDGGRYQSDRSDEERSRDVRGARLTMGLMIQESTLRAFFDASKGLARGTGFLARFLLAWPASTMGTRFYTPPALGNPALAEFNRRITALLKHSVPIDDDGVLTPPALPLTPEAKEAWIEFHDAIEKELASGGEFYDVKDVAAKTADNAVRLAALFQVFEHGMGGAVGLDCFESASLITAWHLHEARRFFGEIALPTELADAARLDRWLIEYYQRERTHFVKKNHVRQHGPIRDGARLDAAIRELAELDRLRLRPDGKKKIIQVNPALMGVMP
jgi:putative DNA primase/helicase